MQMNQTADQLIHPTPRKDDEESSWLDTVVSTNVGSL